MLGDYSGGFIMKIGDAIGSDLIEEFIVDIVM